MSTIIVNNNYNGDSTYTARKNNAAQISSLMKERESLQEELKSLQKEVTSTNRNESETVEAEMESLQSQITNIDSQIARLQAEEEENVSSNSSNNDSKVEYPSQKLDNPEALNTTLSKLDENTKLLENEIILDKARGFNTDDKDKILSNIKNNIENINSKLQDVNGDESKKISEDIELVGNFVDSEA